jgi:sialic acid synthase SpsE
VSNPHSHRDAETAGGRAPRQTFVIAEMACSHEGDPALARTIIDAAGAAGADAIQFQIWRVRDIMVPHHPDYGKNSRLQLPDRVWSELAAYVHGRHPHMQIIGCVQNRDVVDLCESFPVAAYKLHSSDLSNPEIVKQVAQTGRRIDLCVGASTLGEIETAIEWIRGASSSEIWLMYGLQLFPTRIDVIHLRYMMQLHHLFQLPVGYQDHCDGGAEAGFWLPAAAIGMGVEIVEKHITHDRSKKGIDHESALNPDEFARFVTMVRQIDLAMGSARPRPFSPEELAYRKYCKKSLVASGDIPAGTVIAAEHLLPRRTPSLGLPPDEAGRLLGRKAKRPLAANELVREEDVA